MSPDRLCVTFNHNGRKRTHRTSLSASLSERVCAADRQTSDVSSPVRAAFSASPINTRRAASAASCLPCFLLLAHTAGNQRPPNLAWYVNLSEKKRDELCVNNKLGKYWHHYCVFRYCDFTHLKMTAPHLSQSMQWNISTLTNEHTLRGSSEQP